MDKHYDKPYRARYIAYRPDGTMAIEFHDFTFKRGFNTAFGQGFAEVSTICNDNGWQLSSMAVKRVVTIDGGDISFLISDEVTNG